MTVERFRDRGPARMIGVELEAELVHDIAPPISGGMFPSREPCVDAVKCEDDIPLQFRAFDKGLISLNRHSTIWSIFKR